METKTADLGDAKRFAEAIHAEFPSRMLAYNLSPSFNWDTTGMSDDEMRRFPEELGQEVGQIIVADVNAEGVKGLLAADRARLGDLIQQRYP